jgi:Right handed beta helix region
MTFAGNPWSDARARRVRRALVHCTALLTWACAAPGSDDGLAAATAGSAGGGAEVARLTLPTQDTVPRDSVADLPHATADARPVPVTGKTIRVGPRGNLQSALNRAQPGDAVLLAPGATYEGNFTLPTRRCAAGAWITVRTDTPDDSLPAEGERITPAFSSRLAKISTPNAQPALKTANPTCQWRLFALEITGTLPKSTIQYGLVVIGDGGDRSSGETQTSVERIPADFILDRLYIHGSPTLNTFRCLAINSARTSVVNSWLSECHAKGFDSQAIEGWNGPGPYLIENNTLEAAGENVMFGGADASIPKLTPSDITIRRNHIRKPPEWKGVWSVKNLFELKHARRVLVEGNIFENNWADGQSGVAIVLKSTNQSGGNPWAQTSNVTFRYNVVRNSPQGLIIAAAPDVVGDKYQVIPATRFRIEQNFFDHIGAFNGSTNGNMLLLLNNLSDVTVAHNTFVFNYDEGLFVTLETSPPGSARNIEITDNITTKARYYSIIHSGIKVGIESMNAFAGSRWKFARNVIVGVGREYVSYHPPGNSYPATMDEMGFVDWRTGDYRLKGGSQFTGRGAKGTNPGADLGRIARETANVVVSPTGRQSLDAAPSLPR